MVDKKIWSVIPARGGSKGVPNKNLRLLGGYPLITYSIQASLLCKEIERTIVTTDSAEIAMVARQYGAEVLQRPQELARDTSTDLEWAEHLIHHQDYRNRLPDLLVHLRPTTPLREPELISDAIKWIMNSSSLRSAHELEESPYKMFALDGVNFKPYLLADLDLDITNLPRQKFPTAYVPNGYVDIIRPSTIATGTMHGREIRAYVTPKCIEIDTLENFNEAELHVKQSYIYRKLSSL